MTQAVWGSHVPGQEEMLLVNQQEQSRFCDTSRVLADRHSAGEHQSQALLLHVPHTLCKTWRTSKYIAQEVLGKRSGHLEVVVLMLEDARLPIAEREVDPLACQVLGLDFDGDRPLQAIPE